MTPEQLKKSIYRLVCSGKLTSRTDDNKAFSYCKNILNIDDKNIFLTDSDSLLEVPEEWVFVKFKYLCEMSMGQTVLKSEMDEHGDPIYSATIEDIPLGYIKHSRNKICLTKGDFVIPARGNSIGFIKRVHDECASGTQTTICMKLIDKEMNEYLYYYLMAFKDTLFAYNGAAIPQITISKISNILIPIPSKEEQQEIVSKIKELLPIVDRYEDAWGKLEKFNTKFPFDMKKSILQTAMKGKLVEQLDNEGSSQELLNNILLSQNAMVKNGQISKPRKYGEITEDEIPFEIPNNWVWARLANVVYNHGQETPTDIFSYIDIGSIDNVNQRLNEVENLIEAKNAPSRARKLVEFGDIIYSTVRPYLHNMCIIDKKFSHKPIASTGFAVLCPFDGLFNKFLFYYLLSPQFDEYANRTDNSKGVAYPAINDDRLFRAVIPLPPYEEQKRIVAKLEELLPLCGKLIK